MIKGIIITSSSGVCLFYKSYGCAFDSEILTNFLVANDIFSAQMIGESMYRIEMKEKTQFVFEKDTQTKLIFVIIADLEDQLHNLQLKLKHIKYAILSNFPEIHYSESDALPKYHKIPNKLRVEKLIDPIILPHFPSGNLINLINYFGIKNSAYIFSSLLAKQNILIFDGNQQLIEELIMTFPLLIPFRELFIIQKIISVDKIGLLVPWIENFNLSQAPNCWWIIGSNKNDFKKTEKSSITFIDVENKRIINGITPSFYEHNLIKSLKNIKDPQIAQLTWANKMHDLINTVKKLLNFNPINKEVLKLHDLQPYFLPLVEKIVQNDFSVNLEIEKHYFTSILNKMFGD